MNPVRDQGQCGSCWSFAAIATLEGRYAVKKGSKVQLSEQQLVDCDTASNGCGGGWSSKALQYIQRVGGSQSRASYPYTGRDGSCRFNAGQVAAKVSGVSGVANAKTSIAGGPLAVYVQAAGAFMSYGGGIFNGVCGQYDHAVTLVGFGVSGSTEYWIIRNSWGTGWGEAGHIRVQINGNCRLTFDSFPTVA
jgi:C1A family cysteine protease